MFPSDDAHPNYAQLKSLIFAKMEAASDLAAQELLDQEAAAIAAASNKKQKKKKKGAKAKSNESSSHLSAETEMRNPPATEMGNPPENPASQTHPSSPTTRRDGTYGADVGEGVRSFSSVDDVDVGLAVVDAGAGDVGAVVGGVGGSVVGRDGGSVVGASAGLGWDDAEEESQEEWRHVLAGGKQATVNDIYLLFAQFAKRTQKNFDALNVKFDELKRKTERVENAASAAYEGNVRNALMHLMKQLLPDCTMLAPFTGKSNVPVPPPQFNDAWASAFKTSVENLNKWREARNERPKVAFPAEIEVDAVGKIVDPNDPQPFRSPRSSASSSPAASITDLATSSAALHAHTNRSFSKLLVAEVSSSSDLPSSPSAFNFAPPTPALPSQKLYWKMLQLERQLYTLAVYYNHSGEIDTLVTLVVLASQSFGCLTQPAALISKILSVSPDSFPRLVRLHSLGKIWLMV
ncbi:hypothetical protein HK104_006192 [Borealophlyctis nickersoniae]|nr:hypothetical protein HK104_006192 [Borealophlyctis nickersoniae]